MAYNSGIQLPKVKLLKSRLEGYCQIQNVLMRPSYNTNLKSFIIIEVADIQQTKKVR